MIDLDEQYIDFIKKVFDVYLGEYKLYLFGSRAKNRAKKYSDVDLAVDSPKLTKEIKSQIETFFETSTIPYEVDIIDLNDITDKFKNLISKDLVKL